MTLIERNRILGGACTHTGTIPSKALREAVLHLSGIQQRGFYGDREGRGKPEITIEDLIARGQQVIRTEMEVIREHMIRNEVEILCGEARFEDLHTLSITRQNATELIEADHVVIATGTVPARPPSVPFDNDHVLDSDNLLELSHLPKSMIIVGGGVIGTEYACMMATLGVRVILTEARPSLLDFVDSEISEAPAVPDAGDGSDAASRRAGRRYHRSARRSGAGDFAVRQAPSGRYAALLHRAAGHDTHAGSGEMSGSSRTTGAG